MSEENWSVKALEEIEQRCSALDWPCEVKLPGEESSGSFVVTFPHGKDSMPRFYRERDAIKFAKVEFENVRFLGDYDAIYDGVSKTIEARVSRLESRGWIDATVLQHYLGRQVSSDDGAGDEPADDEVDPAPKPAPYTLRVERGARWLEIAPPTDTFVALCGRARGHIFRIPYEVEFRQDDAVSHLEEVANAFFFDLDVRYGLGIGLSTEQRRRRRVPRSSEREPEYPANVYSQEPLALLRYGRGAVGFPLLEFLAYYQALEHFFPYFGRQAVVQNLRSELKSPAFDFAKDAHIERIISVAGPAVKAGGSEREQMRETVRAVADVAIVREFFEEMGQEHFTKKSGGVDHVAKLQFGSGAPDLRDQVAARLYEIRCRIVHAKSDGGANEQPVLLPDSKESHRLAPDIHLMRLLAERAIIARARREGGALVPPN